MAALGLFVFWLIMLPLSMMWSGYVLSVLWGWFAVPIFALPAISVAQAIAVRLVVFYMTMESATPNKERTDSESVALIVLVPLIFLVMGWAVKQFM